MRLEDIKEVKEFLRSKGFTDDAIRGAMRVAENEERIEQFRDSEDAKRYQELQDFKPNPGQATLTEVGKVTEGVRYFTDPNPDSEHEKIYPSEFEMKRTGGDIPIYQEDIDMIKKAVPLAKKLLEMQKAREDVGTLVADAYDLPQGPDTTECINEINAQDVVEGIDVPARERQPLTKEEVVQGIENAKSLMEDPEFNRQVEWAAKNQNNDNKYPKTNKVRPDIDDRPYPTKPEMNRIITEAMNERDWYLTPEEKDHYKKIFAGIENHGYDRKHKPRKLMTTEDLERIDQPPAVLRKYIDITGERDAEAEERARKWYQQRIAEREEDRTRYPEVCNKNVSEPGFKAVDKQVPDPNTKGFKTVHPSIFDNILEQMSDVHRRKNADYGDAAYEGYKEFGIQYYIIQLHNKLNRLKSLTKDNFKPQVNESIEDTLLDMANYAVLALESLKRED